MSKKLRRKTKRVKKFRRDDKSALQKPAEPLVRAFELLVGLPDDIILSRRGKDIPQKRERL